MSHHGFLAAKATAVRARRAREAPRGRALEALRHQAVRTRPPPSFTAALNGGETVALVAEFKRRSPGAGPLALRERPEEVAALYVDSGAAGVSVLTDGEHFEGKLEDLAAVVDRSGHATPTLRKDFIVDEAGICESRAAGAAAVLLIAAMLDDVELGRSLTAARELGLDCLVEVHQERELERALGAGATVVGINNRDLRRLETDLAVTERLAPLVPDGIVLVSESGIRNAGHVARVRDAGADAVLVGEALLRLEPGGRRELTRELASVPR